MPYNQSIEMLERKQVDVALTLNNLSGTAPKYSSDIYVSYQNVVLSLKSKKLSIQQL
ncbi:MAG: hypothetical protein ACI9UT_000592 [Flavobacteriales bacterium]|jgi:hypothetical protein